MHLVIQQRENEGIVILDLQGRLVLGPEDVSLRERILLLFSQGTRNIILNLQEVSEIDTAGLGTLVFYTEKFRGAGGKLVLTNLGSHDVSTASLLKLDTELETYKNEQDAVNSFFPDRAVPHYDILEVAEDLAARHATEQKPESQK